MGKSLDRLWKTRWKLRSRDSGNACPQLLQNEMPALAD